MRNRISRLIATLSIVGLVAVLTATNVSAQATAFCDGLEATIVGTAGPDTITGTPGPDVIAGLQGNDVIDGGGGDDVICGGQGNDVLRGGQGFDIIFGAQGDDIIYAATGTSVADREDVRGARMFGGQGNDEIHGTARWDRMQGGPGNDSLFGYEGRDWMRAGADNDSVDGGPGIDDLHGGNGRDDIQLTAGDVVRGGAGLDLCNLASGEAGERRSCGLNEREKPFVPAGAFTFVERRGDSWTGQITGLVDVERSQFSNTEGRCFLVLGQITPEFISDGTAISDGFATPELGVLVGGQYFDDSGGQCDTDEAEELGYEWILRARATVGTDIPFFAEIFLPEVETGAVNTIVVDDPNSADAVLVAPVRLPSIPLPTGLQVGTTVPNEGPLGVSAEFDHTERDDSWMGRVTSVEEVPFSRFSNREGRCLLVIGELTPTAIDEGLVSDRFSTPNILSLIHI